MMKKAMTREETAAMIREQQRATVLEAAWYLKRIEQLRAQQSEEREPGKES